MNTNGIAANITEPAGPPWGALHGIRPIKLFTRLLAQGMTPEAAEDYLLTRYGMWREKADVAMRIALRELEIMRTYTPESISLYIGIPFCPTRCAYCSFVSSAVGRMGKYMEPYLAALKKEIAASASLVRALGLKIETVYFGGGTPTTLSVQQLDDLLYELGRQFDLSAVREYTVEAGRPDTIDRHKLRSLKRNGVTRVSINPQTMNQPTLDLIGRRHTTEQIRAAYAMTRELDFAQINMDLIAGLPGEKPDDFRRSLDEVCAMDPEDITVHTMCIKRAADLRENKNRLPIPDGEAVREMITYAYQKLAACGFAPYYLYRQKDMVGDMENVGFSKPGAECVYNIFIMEEIQTILSLGCGGVTKLVHNGHIERIFNVKDIIEYIGRIDEMIERKNRIRERLES